MRKAKCAALLLAVLLVMGGVGVYLTMIRPAALVTQAAFEKLRVGMTRSDVIAILGPPGNRAGAFESAYHSPPLRLAPSARGRTPDSSVAFFLQLDEPQELPPGDIWVERSRGRHGFHVQAIWLRFDEHGNLEDGRYFQTWGAYQPTFLDRMKDWLAEQLGLAALRSLLPADLAFASLPGLKESSAG